MVNSIMENFDWKKTQKTMKILNWSWIGIGGNGVPNIDDLKKTAKYLIDNSIVGALDSKTLKSDELYSSSTGGLKASVTKDRYKHINFISLEFILTDWCDDGD